ncbi:hypothetical protein H0264_31270 [Nocardia huaxiensis]|uniref:Uncharacterized protein n=1 Tax=Nocardia huaxiensis TaxID=2755382 RepID=A0A7D6VDB2_9NOCA|nr:hypothetical protein [Nocardia huaxiensis]QLY29675.1 hypothetical protein H0264_31270 [Nocardia huaxiensis]
MCAEFDSLRLGIPPIPECFMPSLRRVSNWAYATRDISPIGMYMFDEYHDEVVEGQGDYVAVCHAGHGSNSYAITYHLVLGSLALYAQAGFGGIYEDPVVDAAKVRRMFNACAFLADAAAAEPRCPNYRLIALYSNFRGVRYRWRKLPGPVVCPGSRAPIAVPSDRLAEPEQADPLADFGAVARALQLHQPCHGQPPAPGC